VLDDPRAADAEGADTVRELVALLPAARGRPIVDRVLSEAVSRKFELAEPVILDLLDREPVAEVDIETERESVGPDYKACR
jgi:hypothetical protein